jgi:hypothetical protein
MHTDDLLPGFPDDPGYRSDLLPKWLKGVAAIIFLLSLICMLLVLDLLTSSIGFGLMDWVTLSYSLLGMCCGAAAAGLLMELRWAVRLSLVTSVGVLFCFFTFLGYDLFFYRRKLWGLVGMEVFVLTVTYLYFRALWKVRRDWAMARQSEPANEKRKLRL